MVKKKKNKTASKTCKKIKEALLTLFETKKIDMITVMDIHEVTGYSRQTFYRHYKSVEEVYKDIISDMFKKFATENILNKNLSLNSFLCCFFQWIEKEMQIVELFLNARGETTLIRLYYTLTSDLLEEIIPVKDISEDMRYREKLILLGGIMSMVYYWIETGFSDSPKELANYIESKLNFNAIRHKWGKE